MYTLPVAKAKAAFEELLAEIGTSCTWKVRSSGVPTTTKNDYSAAAGRFDPLSEDYGPETSSTSVYSTGTSIKVYKDVPSRLQGENAGQMVTGTSLAHCSANNAVAVGDVLVIGAETWAVTGSRLAAPPIYRELTLERKAV